MKNIFIILLFISITLFSDSFANELHYNKQSQKEIDLMLEKRLNLTEQQINSLQQERPQRIKEMEKIIKQMQIQHDKIREQYLIGIPKWQADIRTAPNKAELVHLKQSADKIRENNRKKLESILTPEQKIEFEKIKQEFSQKNPRHKKSY